MVDVVRQRWTLHTEKPQLDQSKIVWIHSYDVDMWREQCHCPSLPSDHDSMHEYPPLSIHVALPEGTIFLHRYYSSFASIARSAHKHFCRDNGKNLECLQWIDAFNMRVKTGHHHPKESSSLNWLVSPPMPPDRNRLTLLISLGSSTWSQYRANVRFWNARISTRSNSLKGQMHCTCRWFICEELDRRFWEYLRHR